MERIYIVSNYNRHRLVTAKLQVIYIRCKPEPDSSYNTFLFFLHGIRRAGNSLRRCFLFVLPLCLSLYLPPNPM
jgi:hypothetical protein